MDVGDRSRTRNLSAYRPIYWALATISFFASLACLRLALASYLDLAPPVAWTLGIASGLASDLSISFFAFGLAVLATLISRRLAIGIYVASSFLIWNIVFCSFSYFKFFKTPLSLWATVNYAENIWSVRGVVERFASESWTLLSLSAWIFAVGFFFAYAMTRDKKESRNFSSHVRTAALAVSFVVTGLFIRQSPTWFSWPVLTESVVCDNVFVRWFDDYQKQGKLAFKHSENFDDVAGLAGQWLKAYYVGDGEHWPASIAAIGQSGQGIERNFSADPAHVAELKSELGLSGTRKTNVVLLFLEGARAFEYLNPDLGQIIYPRLHKLLAEHGIFFKETYSTATMTIAGEYSTLCSGMDRMYGPAVFKSVPNLDARCLPTLFSENGYDTYWMNPFRKDFGGKYVFEVAHGTEYFDDDSYFVPRSREEAVNANDWGLADKPFLHRALEKLEDIHKTGRPFFAHLLTVGTHSPWNRTLEGFTLPSDLAQKTQSSSDHQGYLSAASALDQALAQFFQEFFNSPLSDDTLVVLLSDHGLTLQPAYPAVTNLQKSLLLPRIMFAAVTKNIQKGRIVNYPVHQMDVAPLIATIADLHGDVSWLGRDPTLGSGTPWAVRYGPRLMYRTGHRLCAQTPENPTMNCWLLENGLDPLLAQTLPSIAEDRMMSADFLKVIRSNEALIESGSLLGSPVQPISQPNRRQLVLPKEISASVHQ